MIEDGSNECMLDLRHWKLYLCCSFYSTKLEIYHAAFEASKEERICIPSILCSNPTSTKHAHTHTLRGSTTSRQTQTQTYPAHATRTQYCNTAVSRLTPQQQRLCHGMDTDIYMDVAMKFFSTLGARDFWRTPPSPLSLSPSNAECYQYT